MGEGKCNVANFIMQFSEEKECLHARGVDLLEDVCA